MKTKIIMVLVAVSFLLSCNTQNKPAGESEEHEEHGPGDVVVLNKNQREALGLRLGSFRMRNLTTVVKLNGQLQVPPESMAEVSAVMGGNVKAIKVFYGDPVKKGQVLAVLEHPDYIKLQEEFAEVAGRLEYLQQEYKRQKELFDNHVGSGRDYQQAKSDFITANTKYEGLKARLQLINLSPDEVKKGHIAHTVNILSPINGFVNEVNIKTGTYVSPQDVLFEIADNTAIHADFMVYEKDVHLVKEGQKVHFTVSNLPGRELTATVFAVGKEFEKNTRAVHIHAMINKKIPGLIAGMYISGHLHADEKYTRALPNEAVVADGTKSYIFVVDNEALDGEENDTGGADSDDKMAFKMVEVIPGIKDDGYTAIKLIDSLPGNARIVLNAAYYLLADLKKEETGDHD